MIRRVILFSAFWLFAVPATADPGAWRGEWPGTDFSRTSVESWAEIVSGGPGRDGIPAVDAPRVAPVAQERRLEPREAVIGLSLNGQARAYPIRYLMWHEIVNDTLGGVPVAVTYCPLCNSGMVFERRVRGRVLSFGVTGKLRHSDMVMYDRQTESWWQQAVGTAIVGDLTGTDLRQLPAVMESWAQFRARHPQGEVLQPPGTSRDYGRNPYAGYDRAARPFLYSGETPPHGIHPLERVIRVGDRAWPMTRIRAAGRLHEAGVVLSWEAGQASALDARQVARGRDVGTVRVRDASSGRDVAHDVLFAFAFHAFWPDGRWMISG